jgi:hypothetical protein
MRLVSEESLTLFMVVISVLAGQHSRPPGETMAEEIGGKSAVGTAERQSGESTSPSDGRPR